jgi:hypothetical protein
MREEDLKKIIESVPPLTGIRKELFELEEKFFSLFGERVPRMMLPSSVTDEQIIAALKICIEEKKNRLSELLKIPSSNNGLYY